MLNRYGRNWSIPDTIIPRETSIPAQEKKTDDDRYLRHLKLLLKKIMEK